MRELREIVGARNVLDDPDVTQRYRVDWTGRFAAPPTTVVRPASTDEVAAVLRVCAQDGIAIVPQGGNTGLVGGSVPLDGEIVLSLERLNAIESVDDLAGQLVVCAGTTLAEVQRAAATAGWSYGVDIASRASATIGGTIATNAGGLHTVRYGDTRRQLTGIELVTGNGQVITELSGVLRNNTGYDVPGLACGSEGTLGVITRARVRLVPTIPNRSAALLRFANPAEAANAAEAIRRFLPTVESIELFFAAGMQLVCETFGLTPPFADTNGGYVLVEAADFDDPTAQLAHAVDSLIGVSDVAVATDSARRAALWEYRERHTEAIAAVGVAHKLDVAVAPGSLAAFVAAVLPTIEAAAPGSRTWLFGHAGEAAIHVNVVGPSPEDYAVDEAVLRLVAQFGGSISAEHGIGRAKRAWLDLAYSAEQQQIRRAIKAAFDPHRICNPAVLI